GTWVDMESIIIRRDPDEAAQIAAYIRNLRLDDERSSLSTLNTLNNACSTLSIAQLNYQNGKWWRGLNGKWYYGLTGRGPNQYTGPRHHALNRAKLLRGLGKATFASGTALTSLQVGTG